jgi:ribosomal protein S18 acetylase RimI-like enzyme
MSLNKNLIQLINQKEFRIKPLSKKVIRENISRFLNIEKDYPSPWAEEDFMEYEKDKWILSRYSKIDKEIVGFLIASHRKETFYLNRLMVNKEYRNKGIGKEMFSYFQRDCKQRKQEDNITLRVLKENIKAISFYDSLGFKIISFNRENGLYFMKKELSF